jgi:hypothetical protein
MIVQLLKKPDVIVDKKRKEKKIKVVREMKNVLRNNTKN